MSLVWAPQAGSVRSWATCWAQHKAMDGNAVVIFAKPPEPGRAKTRLLATLSPQQAAQTHRACLEDTVRLVERIPACRKWLQVAAPREQAQQMATSLQLNPRWRVSPQRGRSLGARLHHALDSLFHAGCRRAVVVGTDTPWMGRERIEQALELLATTDVVLGPTADGGYYLMGARRVFPPMFRNIPWGTSLVFERTIGALERAHVRYRVLQRDFDLDRPEDLARAADLLRQDASRAPALAGLLTSLKAGSASGSSRRQRPARRNKTRRPGRG